MAPPEAHESPVAPVYGDGSTVIDWRTEGAIDLTVGAGATMAERRLAYGGGALGIALAVGLYRLGRLSWTWQQLALAAVIAGDVVAGLVANSLNSCKRFYHARARPGEAALVRFARNPYVFSALHVYPLLVGRLFEGGEPGYGVFWYLLLQAATWITLHTPLYLRRPSAMLIAAATVPLNFYVLRAPTGWEWLAPLLFLKIVVGHLVREEPYRPAPAPQETL
jgi:hypothetical protein